MFLVAKKLNNLGNQSAFVNKFFNYNLKHTEKFSKAIVVETESTYNITLEATMAIPLPSNPIIISKQDLHTWLANQFGPNWYQ